MKRPCEKCDNWGNNSLHSPCDYCDKTNNWEHFISIEDAQKKRDEFEKILEEVKSKKIEETRTELTVEKINIFKIHKPEIRTWVEVKIDGKWAIPRDYIQVIFPDGPILHPTAEQLERYESIRLVQCTYHPEKDGVMVQQYINEVQGER